MNGWIDVAGWTLLHFVWQGALAAAVAAVGFRVFRSAPARYAFACGTLAVTLAAPVITAWSIARHVPPSTAFLISTSSDATRSVVTGAPAARPAPAADTRPAPPQTSVLPSIDLASVMPYVVSLWLSGVALLLARLAGGYWRIRRLHRAAFDEPVSRWHSAAESIARRLRLPRPVFIVDSMRVDTPTVIGWLRPVILLPVAAMASLAPSQVEAILAHELAHIRRHDFLVNLLQTVAETLLFYHPAVWWLSSRIRTERENCCDDVAVEVCGDPVAYAAALTELAAWTLRGAPLAVAATSGSLLGRVRRLLRVPSDGRPRSSNGMIAFGLALAVVVIAGSVRAISVAQSAQSDADAAAAAPPGPAKINAMLGFTLFPQPPQWPDDDPAGARAWTVALQHPAGEIPLRGFSGRSLLRHAYGAFGIPIVGVPEWVDREWFELSAFSDAMFVAGVADPEAMNTALRDLLEQQLGVVTHRETREFAVYMLVKANADGTLGPNIRRSVAKCWDTDTLRQAGTPGRTVREIGYRFCGLDHRFTGMVALRTTMAEFAESIRPHDTPLTPQYPIVDRTGLEGAYDFEVSFGPIPLAAIGHAHPAVGTLLSPFGVRSMFTALPEQLGLKLVESLAPFEVLVIDRIEKPAT